MNYNKVTIGGRLTRDPEVRFTQAGLGIAKFSVAINRKRKDESGEWVNADATFVEVSIFGKRGEAFSKYHKRGGECLIDGELRLDHWEDRKTGEKKQKLYVIGNEWHFVGQGDGGQQGGTGDAVASVAADQSGGSVQSAVVVPDDDTPF